MPQDLEMDDNSCDGFPIPRRSEDSDTNSSSSSVATRTSSIESDISRRSIAWKYFTSIDRFSARCNHCGKIFRSVSGSTTSMLRHARSHPGFVAAKGMFYNKNIIFIKGIFNLSSLHAQSNTPRCRALSFMYLLYDICSVCVRACVRAFFEKVSSRSSFRKL